MQNRETHLKHERERARQLFREYAARADDTSLAHEVREHNFRAAMTAGNYEIALQLAQAEPEREIPDRPDPL